MIELKVKWSDGTVSYVYKETFNQAIQAAAREATRRNMTYDIID